MEGTVKWFNSGKGYGFITGSDAKDYFAHSSSIAGDNKSLEVGQKVNFEPSAGDRGPVAKEIK